MLIINSKVISNGELLENAFVRYADGFITEIGSMDSLRILDDEAYFDAKGLVLCAGYIDQHTHGAVGYDTMDASKEAMDAICRHHFRNGELTFLPTTLTATMEQTENVFDLIEHYTPPVPVDIPGVHMEGPFFSVKNRGAHIERLLTTPDKNWYDFMERHAKHVKMISLSPELEGMTDFIRFCSQRGIVVSGGHDDGYDDPINAAIEAGMRNVTHVFCCSSGITRVGSPKKRLGLTQIALVDDRLYVEALADGNGIPYELLPLLFRAKGRNKVIYISDSIRASGLEPGQYTLGSGEGCVQVDVTETAAILHGENLFAGSIACISKMVEDTVRFSGIPLTDAVLAATKNPATLLGLDDRGDILPGKIAAFNLIDMNGKLQGTIVNNCFYKDGEKNDF